MNRTRTCQWTFTLLACLGMIFPMSPAYAQTPASSADSPAAVALVAPPLVGDVELAAGGVLRGVAVDLDGAPIAEADVVLRQGPSELVRLKTDANGAFAIAAMCGGTYEIVVAGHTQLFRVWMPGTAPPKSGQVAMVVAGGPVVRGQKPLGCLFQSDAFLITVVAAALIAVPIAIHNSSREPASP